MARPKHTNPEQFTSGEISHGTGISMRNLQVIRDNGLAPEGDQWLPSGLWDLDGLLQFAITGAFVSSGLPLLQAAKMSKETRILHMKWGFGLVSRLWNIRTHGVEVWTPETDEFDYEFWLHHALRLNRSKNYSVGHAQTEDMVILVADGQYAMLEMHDPKHRLNMAWGGHTVPGGPEPFCRLLPKNDPSGRLIIAADEDPRAFDNDGSLEMLNEYRDALYNALGVLRINISLATRNCVDRIHDLRFEKGGQIFQQS